MLTTKLTKYDLTSLRSYAKKMSYRIFYDSYRKQTCIVNPKTHKRVFVYKDNYRYIVEDDHNNRENIDFTIELCLTDRFNIHDGRHKKLKKFSYGIISIEY
jgi:hypothetical protein